MLPSASRRNNTPKDPSVPTSFVLHRDLSATPPFVVSANHHYLNLSDGSKILDASCGAAVSCLGHGHPAVVSTLKSHLNNSVSYVHSLFYTVPAVESLCAELIAGTQNRMARAYIVSSGSEAMEAALKLARQYFLEKDPPEPQRAHIISRWGSYHGRRLGAKREKFLPLVEGFPSRGESEEEYVERLGKELEEEFERVGSGKVVAFVAESVVGAALGCVPPLPTYFPTVARICRKYGALLILDEVMSGMGRCGTLHAWEQFLPHDPSFLPDIQTIGKGLSVSSVLASGSGQFAHGHTFQAHPFACAAALAVQRIVREQNLVSNVRVVGEFLKKELVGELGEHRFVGDIRGWGLFIGIEFVRDKVSKEPFPKEVGVAMRGTVDGTRGDHVLIAPVYGLTMDEAREIVRLVAGVVREVLEEIGEATSGVEGKLN
ncbi:pyridoxal phosphate-dependent transferase [Kalaharituber pfeilii]|nr:pyridoxal phosphate-dependent transferase [Kalaharituber pfeilii]